MELHLDQGPVFVHLDPYFTITGINKAGCNLLGCTPADIIGRDWFETFLPHEKPNGNKEPVSAPYRAGDWGHHKLYEHTVQTASGSMRPIRWHTCPMQDGQGTVTGSIAMGSLIAQNHTAPNETRGTQESRKEVLSAALEAQEKERQLLAGELHENVTQILTTCKLILEHNESCNELPVIKKAVEYIQKVINRVRGISHWLNPKQLTEIGLEAAIREMIGELAPSGHPHFSLRTSDHQLVARLHPSLQLSIFRIIQEQCSNIVRYAQADRAEIYLHFNFESVELRITDNGKGFNIKQTPFGLGLRNIKNRAENHEGHMLLDTAPGSGCRLYVYLPLP